MLSKFKLTPGKAGIIGTILSAYFFLSVTIHGFLLPGYNHIRDTVSVLAMGEFGWIQLINFAVLFLSVAFIGYGLNKKVVISKKRLISKVIIFSLIGIIVTLIFPSDKPQNELQSMFQSMSLTGKVHYLTAFVMILLMALLLFLVIQNMKQDIHWKKLVPFSKIVLSFNLVFGVLWFYFNELGLYFYIKGITQKIIILNTLIWLAVVGYRLWRQEKPQAN